jgi:hypothetical protein
MLATSLATGRSAMAEAPQRYCSNCGHELSPEDQFCSNCGTPVHRAARVPTPEADVPVPPPPQQAGGTAPPPQQAGVPEQSWTQRHARLVGCLGLIGVLVFFVVLIEALPGGGGGGGGSGGAGAGGNEPAQNQDQGQQQGQQEQQPGPQSEYTVGQTATVGNVEWTVTDAFVTELLRSGFGTQKRGRFVVVDFTFTNNRPEEVTLDPELHMILRDAQGREFGTDFDAWEFVPTDLNIFLEPVNPGLSQDGRVIYEVPPDAKGFTLTLDDVEFAEDESAVFDLSDMGLRSYDPASPGATASPGL